MRHLLSLSLALSVGLFVGCGGKSESEKSGDGGDGGGGDPLETAMKDMTDLVENVADTFESIKSKKDVDAAKDKMEKFKKDAEGMSTRIGTIMAEKGKDKKPEEAMAVFADMQKAAMKYEARLKKAEERIQEALKKMDPDARAAVEKAVPKMGGGPK